MHWAVDYDDATQFISTKTPFDGRASKPAMSRLQRTFKHCARDRSFSCFRRLAGEHWVASSRPAEGNRNLYHQRIRRMR
jgi:hypothetical protein